MSADETTLRSYLEPISSLLKQDGLTDLCINRPHEVWCEGDNGWSQHEISDDRLGLNGLLGLARLAAGFTKQDIRAIMNTDPASRAGRYGLHNNPQAFASQIELGQVQETWLFRQYRGQCKYIEYYFRNYVMAQPSSICAMPIPVIQAQLPQFTPIVPPLPLSS